MADPNSVQDYLESAKEWLDSATKVKDTDQIQPLLMLFIQLS